MNQPINYLYQWAFGSFFVAQFLSLTILGLGVWFEFLRGYSISVLIYGGH
jgi:hypothetical protein